MTVIIQRSRTTSSSRTAADPHAGGHSRALVLEALRQLVPYTPPMAREHGRCPCGVWGPTSEEAMCRTCRRGAIDEHGSRLSGLLTTITYDHRDVRLHWTGSCAEPTAFTPRVDFRAPDVCDPHGAPILMRWFDHWADDQLIAACAAGASDEQIVALALAMAHYALATLVVHEVGEWSTYRNVQIYPPHRPDPHLPHDEDSGPDGNGQIVLWLTYGGPESVATRRDEQGAAAAAAAARCPVRWEDLGTLPGQTLRIRPDGVTVIPPGSTTSTTTPWSALHADEDSLAAALRDVHHTMVMSELAVVAEHLRLSGEPVLAPSPGHGPNGGQVSWGAYLTYDG